MAGWSIIGNRYPFTYSEPPERVVLERTDYSDSVVYIPERTCRITATATDGLMTDDPKKRFWLSCGHDVGMYGLDRQPNYCPSCGARITEEDTDGRQQD